MLDSDAAKGVGWEWVGRKYRCKVENSSWAHISSTLSIDKHHGISVWAGPITVSGPCGVMSCLNHPNKGKLLNSRDTEQRKHK